MAVINVSDLKTYYKTRFGEKVRSVDGVSFSLQEGRVLGIAGESGCGKSTLAMSVMGYYLPPLNFDSGSIEVAGHDIMKLPYKELRKSVLGREIAYIPQAAMNVLNPTVRIINFICDIMKEHFPDVKRAEVEKMAEQRFSALGLPERVLRAYPSELSGGMKQRTVIAISTFLSPHVLIADEPTSALDVSTQKVVISMLKKMMNDGDVKSMIFITHELPLLRHVAHDIAVMYAGEFVEIGASEKIIFDPIHPYSHALMGSVIVPEDGMKGQKLSTIPGAPPNLKNVPPGCRFAQRCVYVCDECRVGKIGNKLSEDGRQYRCIFDEHDLRKKRDYTRAASSAV